MFHSITTFARGFNVFASPSQMKQRLSKTGRGATRTAPLSLQRLEDRRLMAGIIPNDPLFVRQWGLEAVQAPSAWEITTGSTKLTTAVLDNGVDYMHPDLYKNIWLNPAEIPRHVRRNLVDTDGDDLITFWDLNDAQNQGPGKITDLNGNGFVDGSDVLRPISEGGWADGSDDGHNGYEDDLVGWDFLDDDNDPIGVHFHGTYIAGIIGAVGNNGEGVAGLNWRSQIMPVRFFPFTDGLTLEQIVDAATAAPEAIRYAVDNGAHLSNNSWGGGIPIAILPAEVLPPILAAIEHAEAAGHLMVFSAGNQSTDIDDDPRLPQFWHAPNTISVAATSRRDELASFSNFGDMSVDLAAPGEHIWTTTVPGRVPVSSIGALYNFGNGTSFAAPHVAGTAALILARNPDLSYLEVKERILNNVDPLPDLEGKVATGGRLNAFKALSAPPVPVAAVAIQQDRKDVLAVDTPDAGRRLDGVCGTEPRKAPVSMYVTSIAQRVVTDPNANCLVIDALFAQFVDEEPA